MFSPGGDGAEFRSMREASIDSPGALFWLVGERWTAWVPSLAEVVGGGGGAEEPASMRAELFSALCGLFSCGPSLDNLLHPQLRQGFLIYHAVLLVCGHCSPLLHCLSSSSKALSLSASCISLWISQKTCPAQCATEASEWWLGLKIFNLLLKESPIMITTHWLSGTEYVYIQ